MMSRWPLVTGSNEPGQTALRTVSLLVIRRTLGHESSAGESARPYQSTVSPYSFAPLAHQTRRARRLRATRRALDTISSDPGASQPCVEEQRQHLLELGVGQRVRRIERTRRRTAPAAARRSARSTGRATHVDLAEAERAWRCRCTSRRRTTVGLDRASPHRRRATSPRARPRPSRRTGRGSAARSASRAGTPARRTAPRGPGRPSGRVASPVGRLDAGGRPPSRR